jgi:SAM-dependent methyltransferase
MIHIDNCINCNSSKLVLKYKSTFDSDESQLASEYFLTNRKKVVHGNILMCMKCSLLITSPQFNLDDYVKIYSKIIENNSDKENNSNNNRYLKLKQFVKQYTKNAKLLDLGCGTGGFISQMKEYDCIGFEISKINKFVKNKDNIISGNFIEYSEIINKHNNNLFDVVTAWDVLEHLPNINDYINSINRILSPGGYFICTLPDAGSFSSKIFGSKWNCILLEHLWYFNKKNFNEYISKYNFDLIKNINVSYNTNLGTLFSRLGQTYKIFNISLNENFKNISITVPIGLMLAVMKKSV